MGVSREHKIAIVVAIVMFFILLYVNVFRDGTSW